MNERIKEFITQAGFITTPNTDVIKNNHFGGYMDGQQFEKFAELIVGECISICKEKERPNLYGVREVETTIKEHFGVEE